MSQNSEDTSKRKKEHIELCLTDKVAFKEKSNGFDKYDFEHYAITEVELDKINFETKFFKKKIDYPFIISCMTGGTSEAENINARLAEAANELNIPLGVGSQRQALENTDYHNTYKIIRQKAPGIPVLGNLGEAQVVQLKSFKEIQFLIDLIEADAFVIHVNPAQELVQKNGESDFKDLLKKTEKLVKKIKVPVIVKEVGAGISYKAAKKLLEAGVKGIDVAGAGGTSWTTVELLRNNDEENDFREWGLPTSYCLKTVSKLKKNNKFILIGSGGINNPFEAAKAHALGADLTASARIILQELFKNDIEGVIEFIRQWYITISRIMYLTGSYKLKDLRNKLIKKEKLY